jgi:hypothetical protein
MEEWGVHGHFCISCQRSKVRTSSAVSLSPLRDLTSHVARRTIIATGSLVSLAWFGNADAHCGR